MNSKQMLEISRKYLRNDKKIPQKIRDLLNEKMVIWCGDLDF